MNCPSCGKNANINENITETYNSDYTIFRRRSCLSCDKTFTTSEQIQTTVIVVVKKDGRREDFQSEKLLSSLKIAARKRKLPAGSLRAIVNDIETRVMGNEHGEISSRIIGEMAITRLKRLDPIAYIRFASIYHQFISVEQMLEELERITSNPSAAIPEQPRLFDILEEITEETLIPPVKLSDHRKVKPA